MRLEYFQMIDRIETVGEEPPHLVASARVPEQATVFEGHFPGHPLMPGVLLIETMAQTAGYLILSRNGFSRMPFLVGVRDAKLRTFVTPSSNLTIRAEVEHEGSGYVVSKAVVHAGDVLVCDAMLTMRIIDFPSPDLAGYLENHARERGLPEPSAP